MSVFLSVGLSHREAPISVREQVAVSADELPARLARLKALPGVREALLLSTCNRVEVFALADERTVADDLVRDLGPIVEQHAVVRAGDEALLHLFRVAASLDSMVVGEAQILGQVKDAAAQAQVAGASGPQLVRVVSCALSAAKRVRTETAIARGAVSLSSVAVQLARKVLGDLSGCTVLLLGAGEMAQLAARELRAGGAKELLVANRSGLRAEELGREVGAIPTSLAELPSLLERADVALCSTAARDPLITREQMAKALKARRFRPLFLIDLAVPRNVEPSVNELENVYVYDLDDLERLAAQNRDLREAELSRAEQIVRDELRAVLSAAKERTTVPVLARLRAQAQTLAEAEAARTLALLGPLGERQERAVEAMALAIVNKLLHGPTARLREEAGDGPLAAAAEELFGLGVGAPADSSASRNEFENERSGRGSESAAGARDREPDRERDCDREPDRERDCDREPDHDRERDREPDHDPNRDTDNLLPFTGRR